MTSAHTLAQTDIGGQKQLAKMYGQLRLFSFMQLGGHAFEEFIFQVESNPLLKRLMYPKRSSNLAEKIRRYTRFLGIQIRSNFYEFPDGIIKDDNALDTENLLEARRDLVSIIEKLGAAHFKRYFLL